MNNNFYVTSDSGRGRIDPEDGKAKTKKNAPVGSNFRKMLDQDQEGKDTEVTDLDENGGYTAEHGAEIAGEQVFSLFGQPKVKSPPVPTRFPMAHESSQPNILHQKPLISKQVADNEETGNYAAIEETGEEPSQTSPLLANGEAVADMPHPVVAKKEVRSIYSPKQQEDVVQANDVRETPATVFAKIKKDPIPGRSALAEASENAAKAEPPLVYRGAKENEGNPFPHEEIDMSRLGPLQGVPPAVGIENVAVAAADKPIPVNPKDLQLLIDQLLKQMTVVTTGDKSETTVIIRHPPIFDGAQVVITSYGSAKGELNLTFGNLRPDAQVIIQQQQQTLLSALEQKGYLVHILTATTVDAQPIILAEGQAARERQQQGQGGGRGEERGSGQEGRGREERQG